VPWKKKWHFATNSNNILFDVKKDNNILELKILSNIMIFLAKLQKTFNHVMSIYATSLTFNKTKGKKLGCKK
jgi:hypothetical protein